MAGKSYGVAKSANIIAVKVLGRDGSGTTADIIEGKMHEITFCYITKICSLFMKIQPNYVTGLNTLLYHKQCDMLKHLNIQP